VVGGRIDFVSDGSGGRVVGVGVSVSEWVSCCCCC